MDELWATLSQFVHAFFKSPLPYLPYLVGFAFLLSGVVNVVRRRNVARVAFRRHRGWRRLTVLPRLLSLPILHNFIGSILLGITVAAWLFASDSATEAFVPRRAIFDNAFFATLITVLTFIGSAALAISSNLWTVSLSNNGNLFQGIKAEVKVIEEMSANLCPKYFSVSEFFAALENLQHVSPDSMPKLRDDYDHLMSDLSGLLQKALNDQPEAFSQDPRFQTFANRVLSIEKHINDSVYSSVRGAIIVGVWGEMTARLFGLVIVGLIVFAVSYIWQTPTATFVTDGVFLIISVLTIAAISDFTSSLERELNEVR